MKERVDLLLVKRGLFDSREKAQRAIMAGLVYSENERIDKPGTKFEESISLRVKGDPLPYVGRGGLKLEKALKVFDFDVSGKLMLDIGASTGGFTDCALQNGAKRVYALDVGFNQLAWKLRNDERVIVMERTNFRHASPADFKVGQPEVATMDVSFISLKLMLPPLKEILVEEGEAVALIKPQFEAGREDVGKKGIVRDPAVHERVITDILDFASVTGFQCLGLDYSPITGGDGNIEFLAHLKKTDLNTSSLNHSEIEAVVQKAHRELRDNKR
ncbi:TlyA family RNA methyltransferase [Pullulanibacillus sp. KACC 23026]|uniref:TlyA family RNA methyltransferase n=1 Tax=Pullulanibacillus sp. KACC 23026 TaxID=3028315 RepID=UPI0023B0B04E|nr:TlyA family RNA methyltransferase [Pullulanibacillus sp. KACC 23026]WEG14323.1 TlyA family RNA methyltransferase [Pullulanibacillus sp. KACC 23026]